MLLNDELLLRQGRYLQLAVTFDYVRYALLGMTAAHMYVCCQHYHNGAANIVRSAITRSASLDALWLADYSLIQSVILHAYT